MKKQKTTDYKTALDDYMEDKNNLILALDVKEAMKDEILSIGYGILTKIETIKASLPKTNLLRRILPKTSKEIKSIEKKINHLQEISEIFYSSADILYDSPRDDERFYTDRNCKELINMSLQVMRAEIKLPRETDYSDPRLKSLKKAMNEFYWELGGASFKTQLGKVIRNVENHLGRINDSLKKYKDLL